MTSEESNLLLKKVCENLMIEMAEVESLESVLSKVYEALILNDEKYLEVSLVLSDYMAGVYTSRFHEKKIGNESLSCMFLALNMLGEELDSEVVSKIYLQKFFEAYDGLFFITNKKGSIRLMNKKFLHFFNVDSEEKYNVNFFSLLNSKVNEKLFGSIIHDINPNFDHYGNVNMVRVKGANQKWIHFDINYQSFKNNNGEIETAFLLRNIENTRCAFR